MSTTEEALDVANHLAQILALISGRPYHALATGRSAPPLQPNKERQ